MRAGPTPRRTLSRMHLSDRTWRGCEWAWRGCEWAWRGLEQAWRGLALASAAILLASVAAQAQTADPTATPLNPSTKAPAATSGGYFIAQGQLVVAPGLHIPNGNLPWALDTVEDKAALIPVHHSAITEPTEVNADAANLTHTVTGVHARTELRSANPVFFLHANDRTENTGDAGRGNPTGWAMVSATVQNGSRTIPHVRFSQISQGTACAAPLVCLQAEALPDGWIKLTATAPLAPGEYALIPVPRQPKPGLLVLYDFAVDPAAAMPKDAVLPGHPPVTATKHRK